MKYEVIWLDRNVFLSTNAVWAYWTRSHSTDIIKARQAHIKTKEIFFFRDPFDYPGQSKRLETLTVAKKMMNAMHDFKPRINVSK